MVSISATQIVEVMQSWPESRHLDLMSISVGDHFSGVGEHSYIVSFYKFPVPMY